MENVGADNFEVAQKAFGKGSDSIDLFEKPEVNKDALEALRNAVGNSTPRGIDTTPKTIVSKEPVALPTPDYFKDFEETLNKPYEFEQEDATDWKSEAVKRFGSDYADLDSREKVYDQSYLQERERDLLDNSTEYQNALRISDGQIDKGQYLKSLINQEKEKNPLTYTQSVYNEKIAEFFDEETGKLNERGEAIMNNFIQTQKDNVASYRQQAKELASKSLNEQKEYKSVLNQQLDQFKFGGLEIDEDTKRKLKEIISTGKLKDIIEKRNTPQDKAKREILWTLLNTDEAFLKVLSQIDKRGVNYGLNQKARNNFN